MKSPFQGVFFPFTVKLEQRWENGTGVSNQESVLFTQPNPGVGVGEA